MTLPTVLATAAQVNDWRDESLSPVAAVLTMGALHDGHAQLVTYAKSHSPEGTRVIATIFVNPTQFNNSTDLEKYPRTLDDDLEILAGVGVDAVFIPSILEIYPDGLSIASPIDPGPVGEILEGKIRPGHFLGMLTVVHRLLEITHANYSFFGEKDFQQLTLVRAMIKELALPIEIIGVPTVRDEFGLALSSRNRRLSAMGLIAARKIPIAMKLVSGAFKDGIEKIEAEDLGKKYLLENKLANLDYLEICAENLIDLPNASNARVFIALNIDGVRLIDNLKVSN